MFVCEKNYNCCNHQYWDSISDVEENCDHLIEVASVTHGWWILKIHDEDDDGGYPLYHCSSCDHPRPHKRDNYCPNCGARMDGEK